MVKHKLILGENAPQSKTQILLTFFKNNLEYNADFVHVIKSFFFMYLFSYIVIAKANNNNFIYFFFFLKDSLVQFQDKLSTQLQMIKKAQNPSLSSSQEQLVQGVQDGRDKNLDEDWVLVHSDSKASGGDKC